MGWVNKSGAACPQQGGRPARAASSSRAQRQARLQGVGRVPRALPGRAPPARQQAPGRARKAREELGFGGCRLVAQRPRRGAPRRAARATLGARGASGRAPCARRLAARLSVHLDQRGALQHGGVGHHAAAHPGDASGLEAAGGDAAGGGDAGHGGAGGGDAGHGHLRVREGEGERGPGGMGGEQRRCGVQQPPAPRRSPAGAAPPSANTAGQRPPARQPPTLLMPMLAAAPMCSPCMRKMLENMPPPLERKPSSSQAYIMSHCGAAGGGVEGKRGGGVGAR